ncbi:MAG TPA: hypothetical protein DC034_04155, partial [Clostridium sp.]|nr:hypothetical protein [Clostridium sp.]
VVTLASGLKGRAIIVGFPKISEEAATICSLLNVDIPNYVIHSEDEVVPKLQEISKRDYQVIIGDVVTTRKAKKLGFNTVLFTSGRESVLKSFNDARKIYKVLKKARMEQMIPAAVVEQAERGIVVFDGAFKCVYSNAYFNSIFGGGLDFIKKEWMDSILNGDKFNTVIELDNFAWKVYGNQIKKENKVYIVFLLDRISGYSRDKIPGVAIKNSSTGETLSLLLESGYMKNILEKVDRCKGTNVPIWILGERGTEKDDLAEFLHFGYEAESGSFVTLDCNLISEGDLGRIISNSDILNIDTGTVYFKDIQELSPSSQNLLNEFLDCNGNIASKFIISSLDNLDDIVEKDKFSLSLYYKISPVTLKIPPLRDRIDEMGSLARLFINEYNTFYGKQIVGIRNDALLELKKHKWKGNMLQFRKTIKQIVMFCKNDYIELNDVREALDNMPCGSDMENDSVELNGTLEEIEKNIIQKILKKNQMNQSKAAKKLGISRSTLWRKLQ